MNRRGEETCGDIDLPFRGRLRNLKLSRIDSRNAPLKLFTFWFQGEPSPFRIVECRSPPRSSVHCPNAYKPTDYKLLNAYVTYQEAYINYQHATWTLFDGLGTVVETPRVK